MLGKYISQTSGHILHKLLSGENAFEITDAFGHKILFAKEESGCCTRQCCNENRSFQMAITDRQDNVVIGADRPLRKVDLSLDVGTKN